MTHEWDSISECKKFFLLIESFHTYSMTVKINLTKKQKLCGKRKWKKNNLHHNWENCFLKKYSFNDFVAFSLFSRTKKNRNDRKTFRMRKKGIEILNRDIVGGAIVTFWQSLLLVRHKILFFNKYWSFRPINAAVWRFWMFDVY